MQDRNERHIERLADRVDRKLKREEELNNRQVAQAFNSRIRDKEQREAFAREQAKADYAYDIYTSAEREFDRDPITEVPDDVKLPKDYFEEVAHKTEYNEKYAEHYMKRFEDTNLEKYRSMSERINNCHKSWFGDHYKQSKVFNVKRVYHCHNRWCWLCSHLKQAKRLFKYTRMFESLLTEYDLYHLVFTVKNVKGKVLEQTRKRMHETMKKIIRYFQGFSKIADMNFTQYGFSGAIRSFEIVINPTDYHPHLHVLFTLKKGLEFPGRNINKYSFDKNSPGQVRSYTDLEILLQKMFYLGVNGQRICKKNIQELKLGYSCRMELVEGSKWHEVFKYATKMSKDGASTCTYKQFCLIDDILSGKRMIQGYGIFEGIDDDIDDNDPTAEILFTKILIMLDRKEKPEHDIYVELEKLNDEVHRGNLTVISKNMSYEYMKTVMEDLRQDLMVEDGFDPF